MIHLSSIHILLITLYLI